MMNFQPILCRTTVKAPPASAFVLFTEHTKDWWKKETPFRTQPNRNFSIAKYAGGRWFERDEDGGEVNWGEVLAFEPAGRLLLGMQLNAQFNYDPSALTEIEIAFANAPGGGSIVTLEHRCLERLGAGAEPMIEAMRAGWERHIEEFAQYAS
jgi:Activator of Hsp90 ATPase homolog 1-like protein